MFFRRARVSSNDNHAAPEPIVHETRIGRDTTIEGNLNSDGHVIVEGRVLGVLRVQRCTVEFDAHVEGQIIADEVFVRGRVTGPIRGYHVHLMPDAEVDGDVVSETLAMDSGARLTGSVWRSEDPLDEGLSVKPKAAQAESTENSREVELWANRRLESYRPIATVRPR
jgi:cytoskeletal protein CcmA (bactofilin family)